MTPKIPSSLKWLIDKRARLQGEIQKTRASLATAKQLIEELSKLEADLVAIDHSLRLHTAVLLAGVPVVSTPELR